MLLYTGVIIFVLIITSIIVFAAHYETEHFDEYHGLKRIRNRKKTHHHH
jgi:hypothetical protein